MMSRLKDLRYSVMLALYLPILLYAFSTYDLSDDSYAVQSIEPVVVGEQSVVLGQPFSARAFLTVGRDEGQQLEAGSGGGLEVVGDSLLQMPTGDLLAEDEQEKTVSYDGQFSFQQVDGQTAQIPVRGSFRVRRPEIVATSEATQSLYRRCLNRIRIDVPGLEGRPLRLQSGSQSTAGRAIALSPAGNGPTAVRVFLADSTTSAKNVFLGEKEFAVIDPPRPELHVRSGGREISNGDNIPRRRAVLSFDIEADEEFRQRYPQDARYSVGRATVFLRKGLTASQKIGTFNLSSGRLVLTRNLRDAEAGDRITIRLEGVARINHAGRAVSVSFSEASRTFGFVLS
jgi:hypothetical protein